MAKRLNGPPLMTGAEVARAYNVHQQTVIRWVNTGKLHPVRLPGGHLRFLRAEIQALMNGTPLTSRQLEVAREQVLGGIS